MAAELNHMNSYDGSPEGPDTLLGEGRFDPALLHALMRAMDGSVADLPPDEPLAQGGPPKSKYPKIIFHEL